MLSIKLLCRLVAADSCIAMCAKQACPAVLLAVLADLSAAILLAGAVHGLSATSANTVPALNGE